ncbi:MAG: DUF4041 domain-containing protein [Gemmatimonas sp.]|nr:DUF4041 domain-containing protein [Gemmatimonas sp.]
MTDTARLRFNPPPGWPKPPAGWSPPKGWTPDPAWPPAPEGWELWEAIDAPAESPQQAAVDVPPSPAAPAANAGMLTALKAENAALRAMLASGKADFEAAILLDDEQVLQHVGIYRYHHPLENAVAYRERLDALTARIVDAVKAGTAIEVSNLFTFDGSLAKGRAMTRDLSALMLRAYNAEAENVVRTLRAGNVETARKRLEKARTTIARLGTMMQMRISESFHALRLEEIALTADYQMRREEEKEAAREERERLREERKVAQELAAARERLDKERAHIVTVLERLQANGESDPTLAQKLADVDAAIAQNDYRAANIRAGYIYVISNRGAFGEHVVKIGLTRRLEPLERVQELGDASVPFRFDVHALFFSEDAVTLEFELHAHFRERRVNWANDRREFFFASPAEVRDVLVARTGNLLEFVEHPESVEYLQSVGYWPTRASSQPAEPSL